MLRGAARRRGVRAEPLRPAGPTSLRWQLRRVITIEWFNEALAKLKARKSEAGGPHAELMLAHKPPVFLPH